MVINHTLELSRRKAVTSPGATDIASTGAGMGTSTYFSDEEAFEDDTLTAGESNLIVNYDASADQGNADTQERVETRVRRYGRGRQPLVGRGVSTTLLGHPDTQPSS